MKVIKTFTCLSISLFISFFCIIQSIRAMNKDINKVLPFFSLQISGPVRECDPMTQLTFVPDGRGICIAKEKGIVSLVSFNKKEEQELISLPGVKYLPFVKACCKPDKSLLVVAAGNCLNKKSGDYKAECQIWHQNQIRRYAFDAVQALALDEEGKFFIVVSDSEVVYLRDIIKNENHVKSIWTQEALKHSVDIACGKEGMIVVAKPLRIILMKWDGQFLKIEKTCDIAHETIKRIFLSQKTIAYLTNEHDIKVLNSSKFPDKPGEASKVITTMWHAVFDHERVISETNPLISALWTKSKSNDESSRSAVMINHKKDDQNFYLSLLLKPFDTVYEYFTSQGTRQIDPNYIREVAISSNGDNVAVITANNMLYWFLVNLETASKEEKTKNNADLTSLINQLTQEGEALKQKTYSTDKTIESASSKPHIKGYSRDKIIRQLKHSDGSSTTRTERKKGSNLKLLVTGPSENLGSNYTEKSSSSHKITKIKENIGSSSGGDINSQIDQLKRSNSDPVPSLVTSGKQIHLDSPRPNSSCVGIIEPLGQGKQGADKQLLGNEEK